MALETNQLHFVLFPFMAQGHLIPMTDIAKLLAQRGAFVTIVTTPVNATRIRPIIDRANEISRNIQLKHLKFPCEEVGLPSGCENVDMLTSAAYVDNFFSAVPMLKGQAEDLFKDLKPRPSCIISDFCVRFTSDIASKFNVPRISFHGQGCFPLLCSLKAHINTELLDSITSDSDFFLLPGFPEEIKFTKAQLPIQKDVDYRRQWWNETMETDLASYGVIVNSFEEMEPSYVKEYSKTRGRKVWCIGPVSLCNQDNIDKATRGNISSIDEHECLKWLDCQQDGSVVYACLGSVCNLLPPQLIELGLALEESKKPFILVIREIVKSKEMEKWLEESKFEERIRGRGLIIWGWAPQVLILSHPAVGGFITHCGWNSTLEGITAGVPLLIWPLFADQFCNEKLVVHELKIGVRVGVEYPSVNADVVVKKEDMKKKIEMLMDKGDEGKARRERAKELSIMAKKSCGRRWILFIKHYIANPRCEGNSKKYKISGHIGMLLKDDDLSATLIQRIQLQGVFD